MTASPFVRTPLSVSKSITFEAAHHLGGPGQPAEYGRLHGHSFVLTVTVRGALDAETGWVEDLGRIDAALRALKAELDHGYLNEIPGLERPTLERLCTWAAERLAPGLPRLSAVEVSRPSLAETCRLDVSAH